MGPGAAPSHSPDRALSTPPSQCSPPFKDCHPPNPKPPLLAAAPDLTLPLQPLVRRFSSTRFIRRRHRCAFISVGLASDKRYPLGIRELPTVTQCQSIAPTPRTRLPVGQPTATTASGCWPLRTQALVPHLAHPWLSRDAVQLALVRNPATLFPTPNSTFVESSTCRHEQSTG